MANTNLYYNPYLDNFNNQLAQSAQNNNTSANTTSSSIAKIPQVDFSYNSLGQQAMDYYINCILDGYSTKWYQPPTATSPGVLYPPNPVTGLMDLEPQIAQLWAGLPYTSLNTAQAAGLSPMPSGQFGVYQNSPTSPTPILNPHTSSYQSIKSIVTTIGTNSSSSNTYNGQNQNSSNQQLITTADSSTPILNNATPSDNSTGVAVGANLVLNFNEAVKAGNGNITIRSTDGSFTRAIAATDTQVTFNGTQVTVNPSVDLAGGKGYYVTIDNGAIKDIAGNGYVGINNNSTFNFTTTSITPNQSQNIASQTTQTTINSITGSTRNDSLSGLSINDEIWGYDGNDSLYGYAGNDKLVGGNGNDTLIGGSGQDTMYGGLGADTFLIGTATDSLYRAPDLIADYSKSQGDVIDLSAIDAKIGGLANDSFSWLQGALNSSNANGALWFSNGTLFGSTNSDTNAEFAIRVQGATSANDLKVNM